VKVLELIWKSQHIIWNLLVIKDMLPLKSVVCFVWRMLAPHSILSLATPSIEIFPLPFGIWNYRLKRQLRQTICCRMHDTEGHRILWAILYWIVFNGRPSPKTKSNTVRSRKRSISDIKWSLE
jgi:hypothetical protein